MKFCNVCDNMFYTTVKEDNLLYFCKNCGHEEINIQNTDNCIYSNDYSNTVASYRSFVNKYTIEDPTLPIITTIQCPNNECITHANSEIQKKVIFIKYDLQNMKYLYVCRHCMSIWKNINPSNYSILSDS